MTGRGGPERRRRRMVRNDIARRGVRDPGVLRAMEAVPREQFVPEDLADAAYEDRPLPIGEGQTISQPYIVAVMAEAADIGPDDRLLEVGTGSGYGAAVLAELGAEVWTVERVPLLANRAAAALAAQGYGRVHVVTGDGTVGHPAAAPYDAIVVTAAGPTVPPPLLGQLVDGGRLVMPVGREHGGQELVRLRRSGDEIDREDLCEVRFVPLVSGRRRDDSSPLASSDEVNRRPTMTDISERFRRVADGFTATIATVPDDAWANPSTCEGWTARDVVGHLVGWLPGPGFLMGTFDVATGAIPSVDDDPVAAWTVVRDAIQAGLDDPEVANRLRNCGPPGEMTFQAAVDMTCIPDVLVHTWDLARAAGVPADLDADEVAAQAAGVDATPPELHAAMRGSGQFGPRVEVAADADDLTRLLAFYGRRA